MVTTHSYRRLGQTIWGGVTTLLVILLLVPVALPWAGAPPLGDVPG